MSENETNLRVTGEEYGMRLDQFVSKHRPEYSRSRIQQWIKDGLVRLNGQPARAKDKLKGGELVELDIQKALDLIEAEDWSPQEIPLDIVFEDEHILLVNKQAGLVVHPGSGNPDRTMVNALIHHDASLAKVPRAGIIHRLDKDTTGLLVVAKTLEAHTRLVEALQDRDFDREYRALVWGELTAGGKINQPIGRHPTQRTRQAVVNNGKPAVTHYRVEERFRAHTLLKVMLETGRTHQIRVHLAHLKLPIVGDPVYGGRLRIPPAASEELMAALRGFKRQALHAARLGLEHPITGEAMSWEVSMPDDMLNLLAVLRTDRKLHAE
ncbi:MAG: 23S rRNA pseudouridine(1911/1915/1917) synthase RluD [Gammaproteobacteria bacterium]|nr:23S rRNA pseudouridine(1911/1915/1917) synthase RluD [Gammaproteobacteria bacterium]